MSLVKRGWANFWKKNSVCGWIPFTSTVALLWLWPKEYWVSFGKLLSVVNVFQQTDSQRRLSLGMAQYMYTSGISGKLRFFTCVRKYWWIFTGWKCTLIWIAYSTLGYIRYLGRISLGMGPTPKDNAQQNRTVIYK